MNILLEGPNYCDFQICTIVDGLQELGHTVYDAQAVGSNYMKVPQTGVEINLFIAADTDNISSVQMPVKGFPKVILHGHDRWLPDYSEVPSGPVKPIMFQAWGCDIAFVRDLDRKQFHATSFPIYPMEFGIERRYKEACHKELFFSKPREFDVVFFGTLTTAKRMDVLQRLDAEFKCHFGNQSTFMQGDSKWSKWVNGRYSHVPKYYEALCHGTFALSPLGAGPTCGRTYEAYAAGCIPLIQRYPKEIEQIVPFVDGENCILWDTADELIPKIRHWLQDFNELTKLQKRCYNFGHFELETKRRAQYMLDKLKEHELI